MSVFLWDNTSLCRKVCVFLEECLCGVMFLFCGRMSLLGKCPCSCQAYRAKEEMPPTISKATVIRYEGHLILHLQTGVPHALQLQYPRAPGQQAGAHVGHRGTHSSRSKGVGTVKHSQHLP